MPCFCYIFIITVIEKEVEIVGTKKIEAKNKHRVNQKFNNAIHNEIIQNKWLSDESINLAQTILFKNFPLISGFEDTTLGPLNMFSVQTGEFVQVLYENNHWVTVSSPTGIGTSVTALKTTFSFSRRPEKMVFPKKSRWNMIFLVLLGKIMFLFLENMVLTLGGK